ncbi:hypothetical protein M8C21_002840, partial [Ambrosia artemisiifolia]
MGGSSRVTVSKTLKVAFHHVNKEEHVIHNIRLRKQSTVEDVLSEMES